MKGEIGFDRRLELAWLEATAGWAARGYSPEQVRKSLKELLEGRLSADVSDGAMRKTITVLLHIWVTVPQCVRELRDEGLELLSDLEVEERKALHWGMCLSTYPFFRDVIAQVGRLALLQEQVTLDQIRRRVVEEWGDTERVQRSVRHVAQSIREWQMLKLTDRKGAYYLSPKLNLINHRLQVWLIETSLIQSPNGFDIRFVLNQPALFPFALNITRVELEKSPRLEIARHGMDHDLVMIRSR